MEVILFFVAVMTIFNAIWMRVNMKAMEMDLKRRPMQVDVYSDGTVRFSGLPNVPDGFYRLCTDDMLTSILDEMEDL